MNAGNSGCTTGMSGRIYTAWTGDYPGNGFASNEAGFTASIRALLKSQIFQWASAIVASLAGDQEAVIAVSGGVGFQNSWVLYADGTFAPPTLVGFWKDALGIVHLQGMISSGTLNTAAFTLPAGYRPALNTVFPTGTSGGYGEARVLSNGDVYPVSGGTGWFSLNGISFRAA